MVPQPSQSGAKDAAMHRLECRSCLDDSPDAPVGLA